MHPVKERLQVFAPVLIKRVTKKQQMQSRARTPGQTRPAGLQTSGIQTHAPKMR
jgi:hypothetical protein